MVTALIFEEGLHFEASDLQVCWDDFAWQGHHFAWLSITFSWQAQYFTGGVEKIAKRIGTRPSPLHSTFHFLKKVSQNCFVFYVVNVVNFENWGSLAESLRFWRCQVQNMEVSQNCFVFWRCQVQKLGKSRRIAAFASLQIDRSIDR